MKLAMVFPGQGSQSVGMLKGYEGLAGVDGVRSAAETALGADFLRLLDGGRAWVKTSGVYETSKHGPPDYEDVAVLARA